MKRLPWVSKVLGLMFGCKVRPLIAEGYPIVRPRDHTVWLDELIYTSYLAASAHYF